MNLFIDMHVFDDSLQGSRTYLKGLYNELILNHKSVHFFFGACNFENLRKEFGDHENVTYVKYWSGNRFIRLALNIPFIIVRNRINISHFQYIAPFFRLSKEILTIHDILFLDYPGLFPSSYRIRNKFFFSRSAARADFLLTVSEYSKKKISEHFKIKEQNIHVIPDGIADDFFKPPESAYDLKAIYGIGKYLLYVSRIEPRKNHLLLVKAFTELKLWNDDYTLVFIGSKALPTEELDNYLLSLPDDIKNKILFIDGAYGDRLKSFYRNCSLFVYPSLAEGFGIPPLEAIASGVPVLCSDSTAMGEFSFLRDRLFNPDSVNDLKEKIIKYLDNGENDFTEDIEHVRKNYSWKNSANIFSNIIFKH